MEAIAASLDQGQRQATRRPGRLGRAASLVPMVNSSLPVLSIAVYWAVRWGYDGFYGKLGVSPEQVGVSQVTMVSRAAYGIGVVVVSVFAFSILLVPVLVPVAKTESWKAFLAMTAVLTLSGLLAEHGSLLPLALMGLAVSCFARTAVLWVRDYEERHGHRPTGAWWQQVVRAWTLVKPLAVAFGLVVVMVLLVAAPWYGRFVGVRYAEALAQGQVRGMPWVPELLGIVIEPVEIVWLDGRSVPAAVRDLDQAVYLGQADGSATFLDLRRHRTVVVPTGTFVLCKRAPNDLSGQDAQPPVCPTGARATP